MEIGPHLQYLDHCPRWLDLRLAGFQLNLPFLLQDEVLVWEQMKVD